MDTLKNDDLDISKNDQVDMIDYDIENKKAKNKAKWCEVSDEFLNNIISSMKGEAKDNLNQNKLDFSGSNKDYYKKKFPKFDDETINILCAIDKKNQEKINVSIE